MSSAHVMEKPSYRNRFIRTDGFLAGNRPAAAVAGVWQNRCTQLAKKAGNTAGALVALMKDASSTDVIVHRGIALTKLLYQCGDRIGSTYSKPIRSARRLAGRFPFDWGDVGTSEGRQQKTGELLFLNYSKQEPYMRYRRCRQNNELVRYVDVPLPGRSYRMTWRSPKIT